MELLFIVGRILFGGYFIYNAYKHFTGVKGLAGYAKMKGIPMPEISVIGTGVLMFLGGLAVITDFKPVLGMWLLVLFMVPTTFLMHTFWKETDPQARMREEIGFTKNLAIIGALLMMIALGSMLSF